MRAKTPLREARFLVAGSMAEEDIRPRLAEDTARLLARSFRACNKDVSKDAGNNTGVSGAGPSS